MEARFALPVSIEQVAVVIKQMSRSDRERLLDLIPELRQMSPYTARRQGDRELAVVSACAGRSVGRWGNSFCRQASRFSAI